MSVLQVKGPLLVSRELSQTSEGAVLLRTDQEDNDKALVPLVYGVLARSVDQDPKNVNRIRYKETSVLSQPDRVSAKIGDDTLGAVALITKSRVPASAALTLTGGLTTLEATVETRDSVNAEKTVTSVNSWPLLGRRAKGELDLLPREFLASASISTNTTQVAYGTQPDTPSLTPTNAALISSVVQDKTLYRAEKTNSVLDTTTVSSLTGLVYTQEGQVASTLKQLVPNGSPLGNTPLTADGSVVPTGTGLSVLSRVELPSIFPLAAKNTNFSPGRLGRFSQGETRINTEQDVPVAAWNGTGDYQYKSTTVVRLRNETVDQELVDSITGYGYSTQYGGAVTTITEGIGTNSGLSDSTNLLDAESNAEAGQSTYRQVVAQGFPSVPSTLYNERGDLVTRTEQFVASATPPTALSFSVVESSVLGQTGSRARKRVDSVSSYRDLTSYRINELCLIETIVDSIVSPSTQPTTGVNVVSDEIKAINGQRSNRIRGTVDASAQSSLILYERTIEPESRVVITTTRKQVIPSTTITVAAQHETRLEPISACKAWLVDQALTSVPSSYQEIRYVEYTFPRLVTTIAFEAITAIDGSGDGLLTTNPIGRGAFTKLVPARVVVSFSTSCPDAATQNQLIPQDLSYSGLFYSIDERRVLNDSITLTYSTGSGNAKWGPVVETVTFTASSPSASDYIDDIGAEICLGSESKKWKFGLWRTETIYITLQ